MNGKYLRRIGGLTLAALMLVGIAFVSPTSVAAQRGQATSGDCTTISISILSALGLALGLLSI